MPRIRVLPDDLVNQIAAGEVVERPASVVKELVENSLDAGATRIEVAIRDGGIRSIRVADDGIGMSAPDAALAFERHATSKLRGAEELGAISSLGFRGEALPSIASVARVRLQTRVATEPLGVEIVGEGRGVGPPRPLATPPGTRIEVAELFERVPARRKFLRTRATEARHVALWLERMALARPDVHFHFERDGRSVLALYPTADPRERTIAVLPPGIGETLIPIEAAASGLRVSGFASPPHLTRGSPGEIHLYVNGRPVRDRLLLHAVRDAYRNALPPGRHPIVVLFLAAPRGEVDVNVHPAKWEVRFRDFSVVRALVRGALGGALQLGPPAPRRPLPAPDALLPSREGPGDWSLLGEPGAAARIERPADRGEGRPPLEFARLRFVGQLLHSYLVCEGERALVILDLHAAHERVLFERMRRSVVSDKLERQALLLPLQVPLAPRGAEALMSARAALDRAGFELEARPPDARGRVPVVLRSVPTLLSRDTGSTSAREPDWGAMLEETAAVLASPEPDESRDGIERALHRALSTAACHAAARSGDRLDPRAVAALLESLDQEIWVPTCPHGRPLVCVLDRAELGRHFLRR
ncbi:MAG: DNA mismatch repair endonuclease MutL [Myxococcota bacterium]